MAKRNVTSIVKHVLALDYYEEKLDRKLQGVPTVGFGSKKREILSTISKLKECYEFYLKGVKYHWSKAMENVEKLSDDERVPPLEELVRNVEAFEEAEEELNFSLSRIRLPREELEEKELVEIFVKTREAYESYRGKIASLRDAAIKSAMELAKLPEFRSAVLGAISARNIENRSLARAYLEEPVQESGSNPFKRGDEV